MTWKIKFRKSAEKEFQKLTKDSRKRIYNFLINKVAPAPRSYGDAMTKVSSIKLWRYRIGSYRLICQIIDSDIIIEIVRIAKRDSVYKNKK